MNTRVIALVFVGILFGAVIGHGFDAAQSQSNPGIEKQLALIGGVFGLIDSHYVDQPNDDKLAEAAINGMLTSLDSNSTYIDANTFAEMLVQKHGKFGGLGIDAIIENGIVKVIAPIDGTPAARGGVKANDLITKIDGDDILGLTMLEVAARMRGPIDTSITLTIIREGQAFDVKLIREEIRVSSVKWCIAGTDNDIGYVRISSFTEQTQQGLEDSVSSLKNRLGSKLKGYIIDLRNNPGGLLDQAVSVSDAFLNRGALLSIRGRSADHTRHFDASDGDLSDGKPLVVLVNGGSASGSEVVAGALQDNKRALIIGTRSFGKGTVQTIFPLGEMGALKLTTARFYTPSGRSIEERGIDPDTIIEQEMSPKSQGKDLSTHCVSIQQQSEKQGNSLAHSLKNATDIESEDLQLNAAIDVLHGTKVTPTLIRK